MTRISLVAVIVLLAAGCVTYEPHAWMRPEQQLPATAVALPVEKLSGIKDAEVKHAASLLEVADYVELSAADMTRLAKGNIKPAPGEKLFLLRGLSWDRHPPLFRKVYVEPSTKEVYVVGYSWMAEFLFPFMKRTSVASPVIASLAFAPSAIIPRAILDSRAFAHERGALHEK